MAQDCPPSPELIELKNKQRAALRREYWKQITNPHAPETGHLFDPGHERFFVNRIAKADHFRETPRTIVRGLFLLVFPIIGSLYLLKSDRRQQMWPLEHSSSVSPIQSRTKSESANSYYTYSQEDRREAKIRSGQVAYKDRLFKFH